MIKPVVLLYQTVGALLARVVEGNFGCHENTCLFRILVPTTEHAVHMIVFWWKLSFTGLFGRRAFQPAD